MSQNIIGFLVKNFGARSMVSIQRPDDTTAYQAGDVIANLGVAASGELTLTGIVKDGETFAVDSDVYEIDTDGSVSDGSVQVDVSSYLDSATGLLTVDTQPTVGDSIAIGDTNSSRSYYFTDDAEAADPYILIGEDLTATQASIVSIINGSGSEILSLGAFDNNVSTVTATLSGLQGNHVVTLSNFTAGTNAFGAETLSGGEDCSAANAAAAIASASIGTTYILSASGDVVNVAASDTGVNGNKINISTTIENAELSSTTLTDGVDPDCLVFIDIIRDIGLYVQDRVFSTIGARLVIDSASIPAGMTSFRLHLYADIPVPINDNAPFEIDPDDIDIYLGYIDIKTPTDVGGKLVSCVDDINFTGIFKDNSRIVYGVLETVSGFTPAKKTIFTIALHSVGV